MTTDIKILKGKVNIIDVIGRYLSLTKKGSERVAMCCFHDDHKASLMVNPQKQVFKCFACGVGGDAIDFLIHKGRTMDEAIKELEYLSGEVKTPRLPAKPSVWKQTMPKDPLIKITHYKFGTPAQVWMYTNERGHLIGYVCRFNVNGGKEIIPYIFATDGQRHEWRWQGFERPRSLYNLHELTKNPDKIVLVVEGEKTCDAAKPLFPEMVCTTWQGGAKAVSATDWEPLRGRNIITWPDNDEPGYTAMLEIARIILRQNDEGATGKVRLIENPKEMPVHWDLADFTGTREEAQQLLKQNLFNIKPLSEWKN